jgi:long-chain fatty acid transport protein
LFFRQISPDTRMIARTTRSVQPMRQAAFMVAGLLACCPAIVHATGYYGGPIGATAVGRAGAFVARADDVSAAFYNPAGFAGIRGTLLQLDNKIGYGTLEYTRQPTWNDVPPEDPEEDPPTRFDPVKNAHPLRLPGPLVGVASNFGLRDWGFALVVYTPSGTANVDYPRDGGQRYMTVSREAVMLTTSLNAAFSPFENLSVGVSIQALSATSIVYQLIVDTNPTSMGFWPISSPFDMLATIRVSDPFTLRTVVGLKYQATPHWEFGLSGQVVPNSIDATGTLSVVPVNPDTLSILEEANVAPEQAITLSRNGVPSNDVELTMPLPLTARAGVRYLQRQGTRELFDVEFDVTYETWSVVDNFLLDTGGLTATFNHPSLPGAPIAIAALDVPKRWRNTITLALGGDYALSDSATVRLGSYYESANATNAYASVDFPSSAHVGATAGGSFSWDALTLAVGYEFRHMLTVRTTEDEGRVRQLKPAASDNPETTFPVVNAGTYRYRSHNLALSGTYRF